VIVDCGVHPVIPDAELRRRMLPPFKFLPFAGPDRYLYPVPGGEYQPDAERSDPAGVARALFEEQGVDLAILTPLTRGIQPDADLGSRICAAINEWQSEAWLAAEAGQGRFRASIRVNPQDPRHAIAEIERWATVPGFVQVAVTTQSLQPYGQRVYYPIWEAAAAHNLPVSFHVDGAAGVEFWPTPVGYPTHYTEFATLLGFTALYHVISLVCEGVMERLPGLKLVCGDGGQDLVGPILWRFDKSWRGLRMETPGAVRRPSDYVGERVRWLWHSWEGPADAEARADWMQLGDAGHFLLYGSNHPHWDAFPAREAATLIAGAGLPTDILGANAVAFYGDRLVPAAAASGQGSR
jgi:predicted TIM-barrel fold metal-dependent hydrolase